MPYEITQCYLPLGRGDFPAFIPAEAGTRFSDPGGMQGWVDLGGGYIPREFTREIRSPISEITKQCHGRDSNLRNLASMFDLGRLWVARGSKWSNQSEMENVLVDCKWSASILSEFGTVRSTQLQELGTRWGPENRPAKMCWISNNLAINLLKFDKLWCIMEWVWLAANDMRGRRPQVAV